MNLIEIDCEMKVKVVQSDVELSDVYLHTKFESHRSVNICLQANVEGVQNCFCLVVATFVPKRNHISRVISFEY